MIEDIIKEYEDVLDFVKQDHQEIEKFFRNELQCENIPKGVLEFYKKYDGCSLSINDIFSLEEIKQILLDEFDDFLDAMGIDKEEGRYVPIADDGMGGYYVFLSSEKDETIYYLDTEFPDEIQDLYKNFAEFLEDICIMDAEL